MGAMRYDMIVALLSLPKYALVRRPIEGIHLVLLFLGLIDLVAIVPDSLIVYQQGLLTILYTLYFFLCCLISFKIILLYIYKDSPNFLCHKNKIIIVKDARPNRPILLHFLSTAQTYAASHILPSDSLYD